MRFVKYCCLLLSVIMCICLFGCGSETPPTADELESNDSTVSTDFDPNAHAPKIEYKVNPLTGVEELLEEEVSLRPVAVAINNIDVAQKVQTGLGAADVVFETEVEGGITRLLALFKAPDKDIAKIGTVRSARVVFAELAASMNCVYIFHGMDENYCRPRLNQLGIPRIEISESNYAERRANGLAREHTLYTSGEKLKTALSNTGYGVGGVETPWLNFSAERETPSSAASTVSAVFNSGYTTRFIYNAETSKYSRANKNGILKDYVTGEEECFTNIFVLKTTMSHYANGIHRNIALNGGEGYYVTSGGYEPITWSKSGTNTPISFKNANGEELSVTAGNSYICIMSTSGKFIAE